MAVFSSLLEKIHTCTICEEHLPHGCRPVVQLNPKAKILIAAQAPGIRVHKSGIPFDDPSGERLRLWMGINKETFYDPEQIAILPMGFCYPGKGKSGDLPPRHECAQEWHEQILEQLPNIKMTLVIGMYAQNYHLSKPKSTLTQLVKEWENYWPSKVPLPHPSPRNNIWFHKNPWFEKELLIPLQVEVKKILSS